MRIEVVTHVRRPLADVYAWCTDYEESDPGLSRSAARRRTIRSRTENRVEFDDDGVMGMAMAAHYQVLLHPPDRWEADSSARMGTGHNEYRLTSEGDGTRIAITFDLHPRGRYRILGVIAGRVLRRRLNRLWSDFAREMEHGH